MDIENNMESKDTVSAFQEGFSEWDTSAELVGPQKSIDTEDDIYGHVFTPGSVLVEYGRAEACCSAAHVNLKVKKLSRKQAGITNQMAEW